MVGEEREEIGRVLVDGINERVVKSQALRVGAETAKPSADRWPNEAASDGGTPNVSYTANMSGRDMWVEDYNQ